MAPHCPWYEDVIFKTLLSFPVSSGIILPNPNCPVATQRSSQMKTLPSLLPLVFPLSHSAYHLPKPTDQPLCSTWMACTYHWDPRWDPDTKRRPTVSFTSPDSSVIGSSHFCSCLFGYLPSPVRHQAWESLPSCPRIQHTHSRWSNTLRGCMNSTAPDLKKLMIE